MSSRSQTQDRRQESGSEDLDAPQAPPKKRGKGKRHPTNLASLMGLYEPLDEDSFSGRMRVTSRMVDLLRLIAEGYPLPEGVRAGQVIAAFEKIALYGYSPPKGAAKAPSQELSAPVYIQIVQPVTSTPLPPASVTSGPVVEVPAPPITPVAGPVDLQVIPPLVVSCSGSDTGTSTSTGTVSSPESGSGAGPGAGPDATPTSAPTHAALAASEVP